jgi:hypothetical protein
MRAHTLAVLIAGGILVAGNMLARPGHAQNAPVQPAGQDATAKPIGKVVSATGSVTIQHVNAVIVQATLGDARTKPGDAVFLGDVVQTGADGKVSIAFTDGTAFDLSSNARMALTDFVYDPKSTSNSTLFSLTKGTFTFVAGKIAKTGDMKIDTPVATMGIRGTTPHIEISDDGTVKFSTLLEEGKAEVTQKLGGPLAPAGPGTAEPSSKPNLDICRGC